MLFDHLTPEERMFWLVTVLLPFVLSCSAIAALIAAGGSAGGMEPTQALGIGAVIAALLCSSCSALTVG